MARTVAGLPEGVRLTDLISLGVVAKSFPVETVKEVLEETGKASRRHREMPAHVVVYYVIAMAFYMQVSYREVLRCLLEGIRWLSGGKLKVKITGKSGISQARRRVGSEPVKRLHDRLVAPIAVRGEQRQTRGAWYRQWRLVSLDGSTLDVANTEENEAEFGRQKTQKGRSAFVQLRFVCLVENGTHVLFGSRLGAYATGENTLADEVIGSLRKGMLCLADRGFFSYPRWVAAKATGAQLLWRVKTNILLPCLKRFEDGSYLSKIYASKKHRLRDQGAIVVRVIEYTLPEVPDAEPFYRLVTTLLDPGQAPAEELASLYPERWEIETALDEFKTHLRGEKIVLRSKTPDLVRQEFYGFMMAHYAVRGIMHEAALKADVDPDRLSYVHAVRVIRRKLAGCPAFSPSAAQSAS